MIYWAKVFALKGCEARTVCCFLLNLFVLILHEQTFRVVYKNINMDNYFVGATACECSVFL